RRDPRIALTLEPFRELAERGRMSGLHLRLLARVLLPERVEGAVALGACARECAVTLGACARECAVTCLLRLGGGLLGLRFQRGSLLRKSDLFRLFGRALRCLAGFARGVEGGRLVSRRSLELLGPAILERSEG